MLLIFYYLNRQQDKAFAPWLAALWASFTFA
jgi:hypothetical protein